MHPRLPQARLHHAKQGLQKKASHQKHSQTSSGALQIKWIYKLCNLNCHFVSFHIFSLSYKTIRKAHVYKLFCYSVAELWVILMIMIFILLHWPIKWDWAATPKFYNFIEETVFCTHCKYIHYTNNFLYCAQRHVLPVSFPVDLLLWQYVHNKSTRKKIGKRPGSSVGSTIDIFHLILARLELTSRVGLGSIPPWGTWFFFLSTNSLF